MDGKALPPGVAEELAAAAPGVAAEVLAPAPAPPRFVGGAARSNKINLEWPVEYDGVTYGAVVLRRLTVAEVAAFMDSIQGQAEDVKVTWPIFRTEESDKPVPEEVLAAFDPDDMDALEKAAVSFLPRRFRINTADPSNTASETALGLPAGAPTAP